MEKRKINLPQKGAGRKLAERLEKLGQQKPPNSMVDKISKDDRKKVATTKGSSEGLDI